MISDTYTIHQGDRFALPTLPIFHNSYWKDAMIRTSFGLSKSWLHFYEGEVKANTDIQKLIGYSCDPFRKDIIRIGISNGYSNNPQHNRYDGKHLHLHAYLTKNFVKYAPKGFGKMFIGMIDPVYGFQVDHYINNDGHPVFETSQAGAVTGRLTMTATTFKCSSLGYNFGPYYQADHYTAPEDLIAVMSFERFPIQR